MDHLYLARGLFDLAGAADAEIAPRITPRRDTQARVFGDLQHGIGFSTGHRDAGFDKTDFGDDGFIGYAVVE